MENSPVLLEEPALLPPSREECGVAISVPAVRHEPRPRPRTGTLFTAHAQYRNLTIPYCTFSLHKLSILDLHPIFLNIPDKSEKHYRIVFNIIIRKNFILQ